MLAAEAEDEVEGSAGVGVEGGSEAEKDVDVERDERGWYAGPSGTESGSGRAWYSAGAGCCCCCCCCGGSGRPRLGPRGVYGERGRGSALGPARGELRAGKGGAARPCARAACGDDVRCGADGRLAVDGEDEGAVAVAVGEWCAAAGLTPTGEPSWSGLGAAAGAGEGDCACAG